MPRIYVVATQEYGDILKVEDTIQAARAWAKAAFPRQVQSVRLWSKSPTCPACDSHPCVCPKKRVG